MCASLQVALQGIPGIRKVFIREAKRVIPDEAAPDGYANETEWMLDTEGVNLLEVSVHGASPVALPHCVLQCPLACNSSSFSRTRCFCTTVGLLRG